MEVADLGSEPPSAPVEAGGGDLPKIVRTRVAVPPTLVPFPKRLVETAQKGKALRCVEVVVNYPEVQGDQVDPRTGALADGVDPHLLPVRTTRVFHN